MQRHWWDHYMNRERANPVHNSYLNPLHLPVAYRTGAEYISL